MNFAPILKEYQAILESNDDGKPLGCDINAGEKKANRFVREIFVKGHQSFRNVEFGQLLESLIGTHKYYTLKSDMASGVPAQFIRQSIMEAAGATSFSSLTNITGQIVFSAILPRYEAEDFVFTKRIPTVSTKFDGEKIPGITRVGDASQKVGEAQPFPLVGVSETYIRTPPLVKRGFRTAITKEAIFFDRTGILLERIVGDTAYDFGLQKEKRAIDAIIDGNATAISANAGGHQYNWRDTNYSTYGANVATTHPWNNLQTSNALVDYNSIQNSWLLLKRMKDPDINEPLNIKPKHLCCGPTLEPTAWRIKRTLTTTTHAGGYATAGNVNEFTAPSPVPAFFDFEVLASQMFEDRLSAAGQALSNWYFGDIEKQLRNMENWPLQILQAPSMSEDEFKLDIVIQHRVDDRSNFSTWEPRYNTQNKA